MFAAPFVLAVSLMTPSSTGADPSRFPIFVRFEGGGDAAAVAALLDAGVTGFVVSAGDEEAIAAIGDAPRILTDVLGPDLAFGPADYAATFEDFLVTRDPRFAIGTHCPLLEPNQRAASERLDTFMWSGDPPYAIALTRDPSWTSMSAPHDLCACASCVSRWHRSLAARFPDAATAASALGVEAVRWEDILPWGVDRVRAWNEDLPRARVRLGAWLDHRESLDVAFAERLSEWSSRVASRTSVPVGFLGGALTNPFGGHDWARLARSVGMLQPPEDPTSREVALACGAPHVLAAVHWTAGEQRFARRHIAEVFFAGAKGAVVAPWTSWVRPEPGGGGLAPTRLAIVAGAILEWIRGEAGRIWLAARPRAAKIAVLYSPRSQKIHWLIDAEPSGIYWPTLAANLDGELLPMARTWWGWQWLLQDLQRPYTWIDEDRLDGGVDPLPAFDALVLPRVISLSSEAEKRIREFVGRGGKLLIDGECGLFDEYGNGLARGRLDDLAGVVRDDAAIPWDSAREGLSVVPFGSIESLRDLESHAAVGAESHPNVCWLDLSIADYVDVRSASAGDHGAALLDRIENWLDGAGGATGVRITRKDRVRPAGLHVHVADADGARMIAVTRTEIPPELNRPDDEIPMDVPVEFTLEFDVPMLVEDFSPESTSREPIAVKSFEFALPIEGCALFRIRDPR